MTNNNTQAESKTMVNATKVLTEVQNGMVEIANEKGIDLSSQFETPEAFKSFVISYTIKTMVKSGYEVKDAYDAIMGSGQYQNLANNVWESLQS